MDSINSTNPFPSFHELRLQHGIALEALYEYAEKGIRLEDIRLFDETGRANPYQADDLLFALSEVSGQHYHRGNVRGIIFVLARPPVSATDPQPRAGVLSTRPTLLELFRAYALDIDWLGEALRLDNQKVWDILVENTSNRPVVEQFLHMLSQYTGVTYTLEMLQTSQPAATSER